MATIKTIKVKVKEKINPSVIKTQCGKFVKIPANVTLPGDDEDLEVNPDWILDKNHPDAKAPVPVAVEDIGKDAAQSVDDKK